MPTQRRRGRHGEGRTERTPAITWAPSELAVITAAAQARGQAVNAFVAESVFGVATGKYGIVTGAGVQGLTPDQVTTIRDVSAQLIDLRRLLANVGGSLNQLARAANSGAPPTAAAIDSALRYLRAQLARHDDVATRLLDLIEPD